MAGATPDQKRRVLAMIEAGRTPQMRRKSRNRAVEILLWECGGDYDAVHAAVNEYREAAGRPPKPTRTRGIRTIKVKVSDVRLPSFDYPEEAAS
jgi:hypothetical protein